MYKQHAEVFYRDGEEKPAEKPFALDPNKARKIATRINSALPASIQDQSASIEGAVRYATIYAADFLEAFIESWNEAAEERNRPDALWENLNDDQRHEALVTACYVKAAELTR